MQRLPDPKTCTWDEAELAANLLEDTVRQFKDRVVPFLAIRIRARRYRLRQAKLRPVDQAPETD